jgi:hypothetical protein
MPPSRRNGSVPWKVWVPPELAIKVERLYLNPLTGKPDYGARSHLITALLEQFISESHKHEEGVVRKLVQSLVEKGRNLEEST